MNSTTNKNIENIIEDNMMGYAASVLLDRALPDLRDGMKPVTRRILYSMFRQKAFSFTKSANCAGKVMELHPHGSSYGVMVGMVQKDNQLHPLLEGKGNFSQKTSRDLAPAADRYSEVKLSEISLDMMKNFEKGIVPFIDNYDGTIQMPKVLPVKYPTILTICQSGIGVGFSSSTLSFNLNEVCDAVINFIESGQYTVLIPDFATGGFILNEPAAFEKINKTGSGTVRLRGKAEIEGNEILITEIPYSTTREVIIEKIIELAKTAKLKEVVDVKDLTGISGMLITVTARRGSDMNLLLEKLYQFTPLQATISANMNILIDDLPKVLGVHQVIEQWLVWRKQCIKNELIYDTKKLSDRLHLMRGLQKVLLDIDKAIEIIRSSKEEEIESNLEKYFKIDNIQSKEVANMRLRNINKEYIVKKTKDIDKIEEELVEKCKTIKDDDKLNQLIITGLQETKEKFGRQRLSQVIEVERVQPIRVVEEVQSYPVWIHLTKEGYCYKFRGTQQPTLKPGDEVTKYFETMNDAQILVFSDDCLCYKIDISRIDETRVTNLGTYLPAFLQMSDMKIVSYSVMDDKNKMILAAYKNNRIAKITLEIFEGRNKVIKNAYNPNQGIVDIITLQEDTTIKVKTDRTEVEVDTSKLNLARNRLATGIYVTRKGELQMVEVA